MNTGKPASKLILQVKSVSKSSQTSWKPLDRVRCLEEICADCVKPHTAINHTQHPRYQFPVRSKKSKTSHALNVIGKKVKASPQKKSVKKRIVLCDRHFFLKTLFFARDNSAPATKSFPSLFLGLDLPNPLIIL